MSTPFNTVFNAAALALLLATHTAAAQHTHHGEHHDHAAQHAHAAPPTPHTPLPELDDAALAAAFPDLDHHAMQHPPAFNTFVLIDQLETWDNAHGSGQHWQAKAWLGGDIERIWLHSEGERRDGRLQEWSLDALYGRALSPWWDLIAGLRHDGGTAPGLTRAAIGVQGLAPYRFDISATAYLGGARKAELALEAEYSLLLSHRLILQPRLEARWAAADDPARGVGHGLNQLQGGLRLRYDITRRFAPYLGFVHERRFGASARWQRDAADPDSGSRWVAGIRVWF